MTSAMTRDAIMQELVRSIAATNPNIDATKIGEDTTFGTLELDSIKVVELSVRLEELFGGRVELDDWVDQHAGSDYSGLTVGSLATFIEKASQAA
jgi:acyl carrier protein